MRSRTTRSFREAFRSLPVDIQVRARKAHALFLKNPRHPSLRFKKVHTVEPVFSARISAGYRALGVVGADQVVWFWVGGDREYERLLRSL